MNRSWKRWLLWTPRVLAIAVCLYLASFALDAFSSEAGVLRSLPGFGMHLVPVLGLLVVVVVAWRWEWVGALVFTCLAIGYTYMARAHPTWIGAIALPLLVVGILYTLSWMRHDELHGATG